MVKMKIRSIKNNPRLNHETLANSEKQKLKSFNKWHLFQNDFKTNEWNRISDRFSLESWTLELLWLEQFPEWSLRSHIFLDFLRIQQLRHLQFHTLLLQSFLWMCHFPSWNNKGKIEVFRSCANIGNLIKKITIRYISWKFSSIVGTFRKNSRELIWWYQV